MVCYYSQRCAPQGNGKSTVPNVCQVLCSKYSCPDQNHDTTNECYKAHGELETKKQVYLGATKILETPAWISLYWTHSWDECEMAPTLRSNEHSLTLLCKGQADISQMGNAGKSISARGNGMHEARRASSWNRSQPRRFGKTRQFMSRIFLQTKPSQEVSGRIKTEHLYAMCKFNILTIQPCFLMVLNL